VSRRGDPLLASWLGRVGYDDALALQREAVAARAAGRGPDRLFLLEHPDVVTIGRAGSAAHVLIDPESARRAGVAVVETDRGGDVTYHGPGQLVGYPVLRLPDDRRDLHRYLRDVEGALIDALAEFGVAAGRSEGRTGVWVGGAKIAAIGVRVSRWVTSHGFALNVSTDLDRFRWIVPCGIAGCRVTSLERQIRRRVPLAEAAAVAARAFAARFDLACDGVRDESAARAEAPCPTS
jgi:lipoyl(octanoyl) transferase